MKRARIISAALTLGVCCLLGRTGWAATYTVNPGLAGAADANNGSAQKPFKTLEHAIDIAAPGDVITAMPGNYPRIVLKKSGTKEKPITLKGCATPSQKHVDLKQLLNPEKLTTFPGDPAANAVCKGFELDGAKFIRIENFEITDIGHTVAGIFLKNTDSIEIVGNFLHDLNPGKGGYGGIRADTHDNKNILVQNNTLFRCQGTSLCIMGDKWIVEGNDISHGTNLNTVTGENVGGEDAVRVFGNGHIIRKNYLHDFQDSEQFVKSDPHLDAFQVFSTWPEDQFAHDILIEGNYCSNITQMFMGSDTDEKKSGISRIDHFTLRGNVFRGASAFALIIGRGCDHFIVENNVVADSFYGAITVNEGSHHAIVRNNIFYNNGRASVAKGAKPPSPSGIDESSCDGSMMDYNLCNLAYTNPKAPAAFDQHTQAGVDPKFVDPAAGDYRLQKDSPAIGAGDPALPGTDGKPLDLGPWQHGGTDGEWMLKFLKH